MCVRESSSLWIISFLDVSMWNTGWPILCTDQEETGKSFKVILARMLMSTHVRWFSKTWDFRFSHRWNRHRRGRRWGWEGWHESFQKIQNVFFVGQKLQLIADALTRRVNMWDVSLLSDSDREAVLVLTVVESDVMQRSMASCVGKTRNAGAFLVPPRRSCAVF